MVGLAVLFLAVREPGSAPTPAPRVTPPLPPAPTPVVVNAPEGVTPIRTQAAAPSPTPAPSTAATPPRAALPPRSERLAAAPAAQPVPPPPRPTADSAARPSPLDASIPTASEAGAANPLPAAPTQGLLAPVASLRPTAPSPPREGPPVDSGRKEQIDAAEAALRRGDRSSAVKLLTPWANAGVLRAQVLLAGAQESRSDGQGSDFQAYVWYSIATRGGEAAASTLRNRVAARLQPAEVRQADLAVERWRPGPEPVAATGHP
jgi:hypothetical protein